MPFITQRVLSHSHFVLLSLSLQQANVVVVFSVVEIIISTFCRPQMLFLAESWNLQPAIQLETIVSLLKECSQVSVLCSTELSECLRFLLTCIPYSKLMSCLCLFAVSVLGSMVADIGLLLNARLLLSSVCRMSSG